jgi:hypothetical protein
MPDRINDNLVFRFDLSPQEDSRDAFPKAIAGYFFD